MRKGISFISYMEEITWPYYPNYLTGWGDKYHSAIKSKLWEFWIPLSTTWRGKAKKFKQKQEEPNMLIISVGWTRHPRGQVTLRPKYLTFSSHKKHARKNTFMLYAKSSITLLHFCLPITKFIDNSYWLQYSRWTKVERSQL